METRRLRELADRLLHEGRPADAGLVIMAASEIDRLRLTAENVADGVSMVSEAMRVT